MSRVQVLRDIRKLLVLQLRTSGISERLIERTLQKRKVRK